MAKLLLVYGLRIWQLCCGSNGFSVCAFQAFEALPGQLGSRRGESGWLIGMQHDKRLFHYHGQEANLVAVPWETDGTDRTIKGLVNVPWSLSADR